MRTAESKKIIIQAGNIQKQIRSSQDDYSQTFSNQLLEILSAQHMIIIQTQIRSRGTNPLLGANPWPHNSHLYSPIHMNTMLTNVVSCQNALIIILKLSAFKILSWCNSCNFEISPNSTHTLSLTWWNTDNFVAAYLQNILDNVTAILKTETSLIQFIQSKSAFFQDSNS